MNTIKLFFAKIRNAWFVSRLETEIYHRIFSHLNCEGDYGYPFDSDDELRKCCQDSSIAARPFVQEIERDITRMPKAYGEPFDLLAENTVAVRSTTDISVQISKWWSRGGLNP